MKSKKQNYKKVLTVVFSIISLIYVFPVVLVVINSFKKKTSINLKPFALPNAKSFVGLDNYINGIEKRFFRNYPFLPSNYFISMIKYWYQTKAVNDNGQFIENGYIFSK